MAEEHELHSTFWKNPKEWFGATNAQQIAVLYFALTFINAAIGGLMALLIRTELWTYEASFFQTAAEYNSAFTLHGSAMIFLVIVPLGAGFGNLLVPRMVAADNNDMYWPRWNNIAFWLLPLGSWLMWTSGAQGAWTVYPPLSLSVPGIDGWIAGLVLVGTSSTIGGINFILTIWKGRAPYIKWSDLDLFVWATLFTSFLAFLATPVLTVALVMVLMDRNFGTFFFDGSLGNPVMFQHIFWFYSHPAVYIMVVPAFGLVSHLISKYARRPIFGYSAMVGSMGAITVLSFAVWVHHMFTTGLDPFVRLTFTTMTFVIAIPSGIKVFNWVTTLYAGNLKLDVPMLFCLSFVIMFTIGGITGVFLNIVPIDIYLQDTYWVVGHFHFIVAASTLQAMFAGIYYYFPDMTGRVYHQKSAKLHFWLWSVGNIVTFTAFTLLGLRGAPRRYYTYPVEFEGLHQMATIGAFTMGLSFIFFISALYLGYTRSEKVKDFDNIYDLGYGYGFPRPYAEWLKEETGEDLHVEHKLSFWAPAGAIAMSFPILAALAYKDIGPFGTYSTNSLMLTLFPADVWGVIFLGISAAFFYTRFSKDMTDQEGWLVTLTGGIITLIFAVLAFMASIQQSVSNLGIDLSILGSGPFTENRRGTERLLPSIAPNAFWGPFFIGALVVYLGFMYYAKSTEPLKEPTLVDKHRNERHWEMWVFLASETIFFSALIGSGIAYRLNNQDNWPDPNDVLNVNLTAINTFILIVSSYTMARGLDAIGKGEMVRFRKFLLFTILLGTSFVLIQASEYVALAEEGIVTLKTVGNRPVETASVLFSSGFYLQTGFHGAHVTVGVILLIFIYLRSTKGGYTQENHEYVEMVGLYWHFVDLVWIILFTILYLI